MCLLGVGSAGGPFLELARVRFERSYIGSGSLAGVDCIPRATYSNGTCRSRHAEWQAKCHERHDGSGNATFGTQNVPWVVHNRVSIGASSVWTKCPLGLVPYGHVVRNRAHLPGNVPGSAPWIAARERGAQPGTSPRESARFRTMISRAACPAFRYPPEFASWYPPECGVGQMSRKTAGRWVGGRDAAFRCPPEFASCHPPGFGSES